MKQSRLEFRNSLTQKCNDHVGNNKSLILSNRSAANTRTKFDSNYWNNYQPNSKSTKIEPVRDDPISRYLPHIHSRLEFTSSFDHMPPIPVGLTIVGGPTESGKSELVRALVTKSFFNYSLVILCGANSKSMVDWLKFFVTMAANNGLRWHARIDKDDIVATPEVLHWLSIMKNNPNKPCLNIIPCEPQQLKQMVEGIETIYHRSMAKCGAAANSLIIYDDSISKQNVTMYTSRFIEGLPFLGASGRHFNISLVMCLQSLTQVEPMFYDMAKMVAVFKFESEDGLKLLLKKALGNAKTFLIELFHENGDDPKDIKKFLEYTILTLRHHECIFRVKDKENNNILFKFMLEHQEISQVPPKTFQVLQKKLDMKALADQPHQPGEPGYSGTDMTELD